MAMEILNMEIVTAMSPTLNCKRISLGLNNNMRPSFCERPGLTSYEGSVEYETRSMGPLQNMFK